MPNSLDTQKLLLAGLFKRWLALFVDMMILAAIGFLLGLLFKDYFVQIGNWGRLIGIIVAGGYFAYLESEFGKGQSIGKKLLKIKVVNTVGSYLTIQQSFIRFLIFWLPMTFNGIILTGEWAYSIPVIIILSVLIFGVGISSLYLIIFNRNTRQALHDIVANTVVVDININKFTITDPIWKVHYYVCAIILVTSIALPFYTNNLLNQEPFKELTEVQKAITDHQDVKTSSIYFGSQYYYTNDDDKKTTYTQLVAYLVDEKLIYNNDLALELINIAYEADPSIKEKDSLSIVFAYHYNIGIWSWSQFNSGTCKPIEKDCSDKILIRESP